MSRTSLGFIHLPVNLYLYLGSSSGGKDGQSMKLASPKPSIQATID